MHQQSADVQNKKSTRNFGCINFILHL